MQKQPDKSVDVLSVESSGFPVILLMHMLRSKSFMMRAGYKLVPEDFFREAEVAYQLIVHLAHAYWEQNHDLIPQQVLRVAIADRLERADDFLDDAGVVMLNSTLDTVYTALDEDVTNGANWIIEKLPEFLQMRRLQPAIRIMADAPANEIGTQLQGVIDLQRSNVISSGARLDCFLPDKATLTPVQRTPTGINFVDGLLGGGVAPNDLIGLLGPSGGGKTLLSIMLSASLAQRERSAAIFVYEFPFMPAYQIRYYSYLAALKQSEIKGRSFETMNPDNRRKIMEALEQVGSYLHPFDMTVRGTTPGIDGLRANLMTLSEEKNRSDCQKTNHPALVIIDQFIPYINRYLTDRNAKVDFARTYMVRAIDELRMLAFEMKTAILLVNQVDTDANERPAYLRPKITDSAEVKSFAHWMNWCLALGHLDDRLKCCWLKLVKANDAPTADCVLQMNGDAGRFENATGRIEVQGRKFVDTRELDGEIINANTLEAPIDPQ